MNHLESLLKRTLLTPLLSWEIFDSVGLGLEFENLPLRISGKYLGYADAAGLEIILFDNQCFGNIWKR